jgi:hypothetical protein
LQPVGVQFILEQVEDALEYFARSIALELPERQGDCSMLAQRVGWLRVERAGGSDPDAVEPQRGMLCETIEVGVVVQNSEPVSGSDRCDQVILVGHAVKTGCKVGELGLRAERCIEDRSGQLKRPQRLELLPQFGVLARVSGAVENFQLEDWRAVKTPVLEGLQPFVADDLVSAALKGGVVDDEISAAEGPG